MVEKMKLGILEHLFFIAVAVICVVGTILTAIRGNWDAVGGFALVAFMITIGYGTLCLVAKNQKKWLPRILLFLDIIGVVGASVLGVIIVAFMIKSGRKDVLEGVCIVGAVLFLYIYLMGWLFAEGAKKGGWGW